MGYKSRRPNWVQILFEKKTNQEFGITVVIGILAMIIRLNDCMNARKVNGDI